MDKLLKAKVTAIEEQGEGSRVCLDFIDALEADEGVLVGNTGHGYGLLLAESDATETYPPRPFRVNAGALHQYLCLDDERTAYLSDLQPGMKVSVYRPDGGRREVALGRIKQERRPMLRIVMECDGDEISLTVQNTDSVKLATVSGPVQALALKPGDVLLCRRDEAGRHLGERIEEYIRER